MNASRVAQARRVTHVGEVSPPMVVSAAKWAIFQRAAETRRVTFVVVLLNVSQAVIVDKQAQVRESDLTLQTAQHGAERLVSKCSTRLMLMETVVSHGQRCSKATRIGGSPSGDGNVG